jgi:hypothetical protein
MFNKYYLIKRILTDDFLTRDLKDEDSEFEMFFIPSTELELYETRTCFIKITMDQFIKDLGNLTPEQVIDIIYQRDEILENLDDKSYAELMIKNQNPFKEILEVLLRVTLDHIYAYEEAEKQLTGKRMVTVIVDGNRHNLMVDGKRAIVQTEITDNIVTIEKCQEVTENIKKVGHDPEKLEFMLYIYTKSKDNECGDFPEECLLDRKVVYYPKTNCMQIWEKGEPVYENFNGVICDDRVALMDCLE